MRLNIKDIREIYKETKQLHRIGTGISTIAFYKENKEKFVYCYTVDREKFKWLKANKAFNFKLLQTKLHNGVKIYKYRVRRFLKLTADEREYVKNFVVKYINELKIADLKVKHLKYVLPYTSREFKKILLKVLKIYNKTLDLDLHIDQFLINKKGRYILLEATHDYKKVENILRKLRKGKNE